MGLNDLLILALAVFYVSEITTRQDGPLGIFRWLRAHIPFGALKCLVCFSIYASALLGFIYPIAPVVVQVIALAGAVVLLDRAVD